MVWLDCCTNTCPWERCPKARFARTLFEQFGCGNSPKLRARPPAQETHYEAAASRLSQNRNAATAYRPRKEHAPRGVRPEFYPENEASDAQTRMALLPYRRLRNSERVPTGARARTSPQPTCARSDYAEIGRASCRERGKSAVSGSEAKR